MKKISIIGYGKMARAIAVSLNNNFELEIIGRNGAKIREFIASNELKNTSFIETKDKIDINDKIVLLAIKPHALDNFIYENVAQAVFSIMAGISLERISGVLKSRAYCRVMPNIASLINAGTNAIYTQNGNAKALADEIFSKSGKNIFLDKESLIDCACAISGSGPAYLALVAEALIDAGVREGLNLETSKELVSGLFSGFSKLLETSEPEIIRRDTTSPNGTTAEGLSALEAHSTRAAFINAVHSAHNRAKNIH